MSVHHDQLAALAAHLCGRRFAIMDAWRAKVAADPHLTTGAALPTAQLNDHLPALLEDFENRLAAGDTATQAAAEQDEQGDAAAHGLHRWQQGFDLLEVSRELGRFNECVVAAIDQCAAADASMHQAALTEARSIWAGLYSVALGSSTAAYFKLQRLEAAGHVADLEQALETVRQMEVQRAELWQQAAHDLRGNLGVVAMATAGLTSARAPVAAKEKFLGALERNVRALHRLLEDVTSLARLQGGQETRALAELDAARLLREIAESVQTAADERRLLLSFDGPDAFMVEGDGVKIRRIVQNLVLNAIKFTTVGGVGVVWGADTAGEGSRWFILVTDTGPGLPMGNATPLAAALTVATAQAHLVKPAPWSGHVPKVRPPQATVPAAARGDRAVAYESEGIGLSIVKRLCTLLDATMEVESKPGQGTTFRILLPMRYAPVPPGDLPAPRIGGLEKPA